MSQWRIARDCGEWFISEISDSWGGGQSFDTEAEAIEELRRIQLRAVLSAEQDLEIAKNRLVEKQRALASPPRVSRMATEKRSNG